MKRPWEVLAAGYVLGELAAGAGASVPAAAVMLTVCFALFFSGRAGKVRTAALLLLPAFLLGMLRMTVELRPMTAELRQMPAELQSLQASEERLSYRIDAMERKNGQLVLTCGDTLLYVPERLCGWADAGGNERRELQIGNRIEVSGKLSAFPAATNPGQFDAASFYRAKGLRRRMYVTGFRITDGRCVPVRQFLYRTRNYCISLLYRGCDAEDAAFLAAVLFGDRSGLGEDFLELYRKNGIAHLLAISGLHVSLLGMGFYHSLRKGGCSYAVSGGLAGGFLVLYGLLTGAGTSVTRAVLMLLLLFLAEWEGRTYDLRTAACIAAVAQLLVHPFELYQCGFQLSFLAVLALGGPAETLIRGFEIRNGFMKSLIASLSVTLCTLPVIAYWFFAVPVFAPCLNLLVIPLMGWILGAGLIVLLLAVICFGLVSGGSGLYFFLRTAEGVVHRLLQVNELLCSVTERIPCSRILTGRPAPLQIFAYVLLLCGSYVWMLRLLALRAARKKEERKAEEEEITVRHAQPDARWYSPAAEPDPAGRQGGTVQEFFERMACLIKEYSCRWPGAVFLLMAALLCLAPHRPRKPEVWFLDVGQGDGIAILYRDSCVLIDGGSSSEKEPGKNILEPFLESKAVSRIETVFLTHADLDHVNGIEYLLSAPDAPQIGQVVLNAAAETDPAYEELKEEIRVSGAQLRYLGAGEEMGMFRCLWPVRGIQDPDVNEQSLVLLFTFGEDRILLTGDAGKVSEPGILREFSYAGSSGDTGKEYSGIAGVGWIDNSGKRKLRDFGPEGGIDVLKAGHHGSSTSSGEEFLQALRPQYTVISCGRNNRYGHPHRETIEALESIGTEICSTAVSGAIRAKLDGKTVKMQEYLENRHVDTIYDTKYN